MGLSNTIDMSKVTLDINAFKALASDTRLDILRALDGKKMSLKDISNATNLNKATLHEHLSKLNEAGLIKKKEREGHKWVYYKLSWKGESLLHPENTKIVVLFATTFIALWAGIIQMIWYVRGRMTDIGSDLYYAQKDGAGSPSAEDGINSIPERLFLDGSSESTSTLYQDPMFLYIAIACFIVFTIVLSISIWKLRENKTPKL
ncbi:ArsR family transcriptional regulator [candidate division WOR-3 bacterium]|nr:ArsR family transcriptional regulator [candidate division WOR-3 bacterium]